ncbi:MAG: hypothetical protein QOH99_94, partial [Frankiaceae bacterium]|nr:hypothetical protein [Frankiaceae bacterium]
MTNVDEALKGFARNSEDAAAEQDLHDVVLRADRSRRVRATRVMTAVGVAAAVAAITSVVFVLSKHEPIAYSSPQPGRSLTGATDGVRCSPVGVGQPPATDVASSFSDHCVVRVLGLEGLGTISPPTAAAPGGSLEKAEALLETAAFYSYVAGVHAPFSGSVGEVRAGYGSVKTDPSVGSVRYDSVNAWVLAWRVDGMLFHCRASASSPNSSAGATEEWQFLVIPSNGQSPRIFKAVTERCGERQPASVDVVFR